PDARRLDRDLDARLGVLARPISDVDFTKRATPSGLFLAEAVRDASKADVGLYSATQYGGTIAAGPVTRRDVYAHTPAYTRQHVVIVDAPAETLRAALAKANVEGQWHAHALLRGDRGRVGVASGAHVIQELLLGQPGVTIRYDDPLGPSVRDAIMRSIERGHSPG
ncbi:hypothetical protein EON77_15395, partial [bacterium]